MPMATFVEQRLNASVKSFWGPLSNLKTLCYSSKEKKIKTTDEKVLPVSADRNLFGRLVIVAKARDVSLEEVLAFELSTMPFSLAHSDGSLRKTNESAMPAQLEKKTEVHQKLPDMILSTLMMLWHSCRW